MIRCATFLFIARVLLLAKPAMADVFPVSSKTLGGISFSIELLGSYEIGLGSDFALLAWGGGATVFSPYGAEFFAGPEAALEVRKYFARKDNMAWAFSFYSGVAYNYLDEPYGAFTPGIKLTRKISHNRLMQSEPYISLSYPFYSDGERPYLPVLTFGYRFVLEWGPKV